VLSAQPGALAVDREIAMPNPPAEGGVDEREELIRRNLVDAQLEAAPRIVCRFRLRLAGNAEQQIDVDAVEAGGPTGTRASS